jgi:copper chaperone CopZ
MTCGHCTSHVTDAVSAVPQVDNVHIDLHAGGISTVIVTGTASPEDVCQVIDDAGYTVLSS